MGIVKKVDEMAIDEMGINQKCIATVYRRLLQSTKDQNVYIHQSFFKVVVHVINIDQWNQLRYSYRCDVSLLCGKKKTKKKTDWA